MRISRSTALLAAIVPSLLANPMTAQSTSYPSQVYGTYSQNGQTRDLLLDLLVPVGSGPWPLLVWVHGGGWQGGNRLPIPASASRQLARGYAVASIDYRLSGTATWPAQIHDCKAAIRFLRANANSYGLDPDRIAVMGSSAGGHLVAALGTMGGVGATTVGSFAVDLEGTVGSHLGTSSRVQCVVDLYGPTTMLHAHDFPTFDHDAPTAPEALLIGGALPLNPEKWASVDPITFVSADDPPLLALHGTDDTTVPFHQSVLLLDALQAIGADAALFAVQDTGHGGAGFGSPAAEAAIDTFLDGHLRDLPAVTIGIAAVDPSANENGDPAAFELSRSGSTQAPLTVRLDLGGDVTAHRDCAPLPLLATIPAGSATLIVSLLPFDDGLVEGDETAIARVLPSGDYRIDQTAAEATAILHDDDPAAGLPLVTVAVIDAGATEAPGDPAAFRVQRAGNTTASLTVDYEIAGSATAGLDYQPLSGSVTLAAGAATALVVVAPIQDQAPEATETVVLRLAAGSTYALGGARTAHVTIADDDRAGSLPIVGVIATEPTVGEPADHGIVTITRTGLPLQPLTVRLATTGTATSGHDYIALPATAVIPTGQRWVRLPIHVLDEPLVEGTESLNVELLPDPTYRIGVAAAATFWLDDDEAVPLPPGPVGLAIGPLAANAVGTATVTGGAPSGFLTIWVGLAPGYLVVPPFGALGLDTMVSGAFVSALFDSTGTATLALPMPGLELVGLRTWWQAFATTAAAPFGALSPTLARELIGAGVR